MKYIIIFIGFLAGDLIATLITDSSIIQWIAGVLCAVLVYELVRFIHYVHYTPQQLLAFHGSDSPITKTTSSGEIREFLSKFHEGGLLIGFDPQQSHVKLDENQWATLSENEKTTLCQVLIQAAIIDGGHEMQTLQITNQAGTTLALYSATTKSLDRKTKGVK